MNLLILFLVLIFVILFRILCNAIDLHNIKKFKHEFIEYCDNQNADIFLAGATVKRLFKQAGIKDKVYPQVDRVTHYSSYETTANFYDKFPTKFLLYRPYSIEAFDLSIQYYQDRFYRSIHPLYWLRGILTFPEYLIQFSTSNDGKAVKFLERFTNFIWSFIVLWVTIFQTETKEYILNLISFFKN